jgi:hypothetical protein
MTQLEPFIMTMNVPKLPLDEETQLSSAYGEPKSKWKTSTVVVDGTTMTVAFPDEEEISSS